MVDDTLQVIRREEAECFLQLAGYSQEQAARIYSMNNPDVDDTTNMRNKVWRTRQPVETQEVDLLEIIYKGDGRDGFPAYIRIDGVEPPQWQPPRYEKTITVLARSCRPLRVFVQFSDGNVVYEPRKFDLALGDLEIHLCPDRNPCRVTIGGYEPMVQSISLHFQEGIAVKTGLITLPAIEK